MEKRTKELLNLKELLRIDKLLKAQNSQSYLPSCASYVINGEIYWDKEELFKLLASCKSIGPSIKCLTATEVKEIIGYEDDGFPPSYRHNGMEFWELSDMEDYLAKKHSNWKLSDIEKYIEKSKK
jgi:hypothetical protein